MIWTKDKGQRTKDKGRRTKDEGRRKVFLFFGSWLLVSLALSSCDVHEFPAIPETRDTQVEIIVGELEMALWLHDSMSVARSISSSSSDLTEGSIRYIIRAYPILNNSTMLDCTKEFIFVRDIADGYANKFNIALPAGNYSVMVWADLSQDGTTYFYDYSDFTGITLRGDYVGNTDYRDAFRGRADIYIPNDYMERTPDTMRITLDRPLAKYEFISTDLQKFVEKELHRIAGSEHSSDNNETADKLDFTDYRVVFNYTGYMPNAYNFWGDKPSNSATGVRFTSSLEQLNKDEASLGFDYVFVNSAETSILVQLEISDASGTVLARSNEINVPLKRNTHTIIKGEYLTQKVEGGIVINPDYDGDHNVVLP